MLKKPDKELDLQTADFLPADSQTIFNNPFFRVIFNAIAVLILGKGFSTINNGYFASALIAAISLLGDYCAFKPSHSDRLLLRRIEIILLFLDTLICSLGVLGILEIELNENQPNIIVSDFAFLTGLSFPALVLYGLMVISFGISALDMFLMKTRADEKINNIKPNSTTR